MSETNEKVIRNSGRTLPFYCKLTSNTVIRLFEDTHILGLIFETSKEI